MGWDWAAQIKPDDYMTFSLPGTRAQCGTTGASRADCHAEDASYRTLNGVPNQVTFYTTPWPDPQKMNPAGLYVQDQMSLNKWTINAGLRFDYLHSSYPSFDVDPRRYVPVAQHFEGADVLSWKDLSPRIAVSFDPFGTGKTALKAAASRYVMQERLTQSTALVVPTRASVSQISRTWTDQKQRLRRRRRSAEPGAERRAGAVAQRELRQTGHQLPSRPRLGERLRRASL